MAERTERKQTANKEINPLLLKSMPRNLDAEAALLGCIMVDDIVAGETLPGMNEDYFFSEANRTVFLAMKELQRVGESIDAISVGDRLGKQGRLEGAGGMEYLAKLVSEIPSAAAADNFAKIVERDYILRKLVYVGAEISNLGYKSTDSQTALSEAQRLVHEIFKDHEKKSLVHISEAASKVVANIEKIQKGEKTDTGIESGFANLDELIYGFKKGTYSVIAARPGVGKTAFALSIALNSAVKQKKRVAVFNMEMTDIEIAGRILTNFSGVPFSAQRKKGAMRGSQIQAWVSSYVRLTESRLFIDDSADNTPAKILAKCRKLSLTEGLDMVIVDYLGLMTTGDRIESRQQEVSQMSRFMKIMSKELDVPVIVLSQLNRSGEMRQGEPKLSDLRESGTIEQDADMIMFLQRYEAGSKEEKGGKSTAVVRNYGYPNVVELYVQKNRNGSLGMIAFDWSGDLQTFTPIAVAEQVEGAPKKIEERSGEAAKTKAGKAEKQKPDSELAEQEIPKESNPLSTQKDGMENGSYPSGESEPADVKGGQQSSIGGEDN